MLWHLYTIIRECTPVFLKPNRCGSLIISIKFKYTGAPSLMMESAGFVNGNVDYILLSKHFCTRKPMTTQAGVISAH